jgi:pimeloyl-ACP methyl ester carboxylesterase
MVKQCAHIRNLSVAYVDMGEGEPFVFLHGLGGDLEQPLAAYGKAEKGVRFLSYDAALHGDTKRLGPRPDFSLHTLVADLEAFLDHHGLKRIVLGGISLGAAVAMNFALRHASRVHSLLIVRPAIGCLPGADNLQVYSTIAELLRLQGRDKGMVSFTLTPWYRSIAEVEYANAASCIRQFMAPCPEDAVVRLSAISRATAFDSFPALEKLCMPVCVVAAKNDSIHPFLLAERIASSISGAWLQEIPSKSSDAAAHQRELNSIIHNFLHNHISNEERETE